MPVQLSVGEDDTVKGRMDKEFCQEALSRLQNDEIGQFYQDNNTIHFISRKLYQRVQGWPNKKKPIRRNVLAQMRMLARLYMNFKKFSSGQVQFKEMFTREHFQMLETAIHETTTSEERGLWSGSQMTFPAMLDKFPTCAFLACTQRAGS